MSNRTRFRPYDPDQLLLLPPDMKDWLAEDDLAYFVMDVVGRMDLSPIYLHYDGSRGGQPPYDPRMMTALLILAYCRGVCSSRKIEQATRENVAFRVVTADQQPDHDTIAEFRRIHLSALAGLFVDVLRLCQKAGLVKLGHVALDGTKVRANASKHKAMSYGRMEKTAAELREEVDRLLSQAESIDAEEDELHGKGRRGDELPEDLRRKRTRLEKIEQAMAELEAEAEREAEAKREEVRKQDEALAAEGKMRRGKKPKEPDGKPKPGAQRNFTDPESRIMKDGASKAFEQAYNCQAAVDEESQVVVATNVTQQTNDKQQVKPLIENLKRSLSEPDGACPPPAAGPDEPTPDNATATTDEPTPAAKQPEPVAKRVSADSGYFSEANVEYLEDEGIDAYVATGRQKHGEAIAEAPRGRIPKAATVKQRMARKLRTVKGRGTYKKRKQIVEPVFGQIKEARGFRRFSLRGLEAVQAEWDFVCLTHNLLKLYRGGWSRGTG